MPSLIIDNDDIATHDERDLLCAWAQDHGIEPEAVGFPLVIDPDAMTLTYPEFGPHNAAGIENRTVAIRALPLLSACRKGDE